MARRAYNDSVNLLERLKVYREGEGEASLILRFWWAFIAVQYLELSGQFVHLDRRHFLTSVLRLVIRTHGKERPSANYVRYVMTELDRLWAVETGRLVGSLTDN